MHESTRRAIDAIEAQQKTVKSRSAQWMVGEQLKDICRREPESAELIARDLEIMEMSIIEAEKKIKAFADKNKVGSFACVTPIEAEQILREFYGLKVPEGAETEKDSQQDAKIISIFDLL